MRKTTEILKTDWSINWDTGELIHKSGVITPIRHIRRARQKHARIRIENGSGMVVLSTPIAAGRDYATRLITAQFGDWLGKHLQLLQVDRGMPDTLRLPGIGRILRLIRANRQSRLREEGDMLYVAETDRLARAQLKSWLLKAAAPLMQELKLLAAGFGIPLSGVSLRLLRSRWGSCSASGEIMLNAYLAFLPEDQIRYVMIHEICHRLHMNHSRAFWNEVRKREPRYRELDKNLRKGFSRIPPWLLTGTAPRQLSQPIRGQKPELL